MNDQVLFLINCGSERHESQLGKLKALQSKWNADEGQT